MGRCLPLTLHYLHLHCPFSFAAAFYLLDWMDGVDGGTLTCCIWFVVCGVCGAVPSTAAPCKTSKCRWDLHLSPMPAIDRAGRTAAACHSRLTTACHTARRRLQPGLDTRGWRRSSCGTPRLRLDPAVFPILAAAACLPLPWNQHLRYLLQTWQ